MLYVSCTGRINLKFFILLFEFFFISFVLLHYLGLSPYRCGKEVISQSLIIFIICSKLIADLLFVYEFVFFGSSSFFSTSILGEYVCFGAKACLVLLK